MRKGLWLPLALLSVFALVALFTGCQDTYTTSAKVYMQQDNYDKAIEQCQLAVDQIPNNHEAYFVLGQAYGKKGLYREMNEAFNKSLAISPLHAAEIQSFKEQFYANLFNDGVGKIKEQKLDTAAERFETAIDILPRKLDGYKNLAYTYTQMGKDSLAIATYRRAIDVDSTDMEIRAFMGILYYRGKQYEKCIDTMEGVLRKANPKTKQYADGLYYTAYSYDLLGKTDKAIQTYETALTNQPNDMDLMFNLGRLYYVQSSYEKALEYFLKVLAGNPEDFDTNMNVGNAYIQMKKFAEALPYLEKASQVQPENSQGWNNLAVAYINLKETAKGEEAFKKAEELRKLGK